MCSAASPGVSDNRPLTSAISSVINGSMVSGPVVFEPESLDWFARVAAASTAFTDDYKGKADAMVKALKSAGLFSVLTALWPMNVEVSGQELINALANTLTMTPTGSMTLTPRSGIAGDGSTGFYDTGIGVSDTTKTNLMAGCYLKSGAGTVAQMGCNNGVINDFSLSATSTFTGRVGSSTNITAASAVKPGLYTMQRNVNTHAGYRQGALIQSATVTNVTLTGTTNILLMRRTTTFSPDLFSLAVAGPALTAQQQADLSTAVNNFINSIT